MRTRVGYTGGQRKSPTYRAIGDHTEAIQIDFDPRVISYEELLRVFWSSHDPCSPSSSTQYRAAVWVHDDAQRAAVRRTREALEEELGDGVVTPLEVLGAFTRAEDYHQKWQVRRNAVLAKELTARFPDPRAFTDSTVVARVNGLLGGHGELDAQLPRLGLSPAGEAEMRRLAR